MDLLVEAGPDRSFFFPGGLVADLEDLLKCPVEVAAEEALHPTLRKRVLREARPL